MQTQHYDAIIIGAGISGIGVAYWLQEKCPNKTYCILEAREALGGTWSLFQYPGIRSDSDMFTFGYRFRPWDNPQSLSDGASILKYLAETVNENGIDSHILYQHRLVVADWSSEKKRWLLKVSSKGQEKVFSCQFLSICSGYYNYHEAHRPSFVGESNYKGQIVLPQFWPKDLDYKGKKVAVVGSGATAVTLVPALANKGAAKVTMVQRSPTYIMNLPNRNALFVISRKLLPNYWAYKITRVINILGSIGIFGISRLFPGLIRKIILKGAAEQLPQGFDTKKHFSPSYDPWDQRLCVVPDGDLFQAISAGKADVVTDHIEKFEADGLCMKSGEKVEADITVLATGLKISLMGEAQFSIDGKPVEVHESMIYKGMMVSDVPNLIYTFGYTNASWTLKVDLTANFFCKLINYMDKKGHNVVYPAREAVATDEPFLNLNSGYIQRAAAMLPKQGSRRPWRVYQNYFIDMLATRFGKINDGVLTFKR